MKVGAAVRSARGASSRRDAGLSRAVYAVALLGFGAVDACARTLPDTIDAIRASIVAVGTVQATRRPPGNFVGTGFVVADGLHVVTNAHVLPARIDTERREHLAILTGLGKNDVRQAQVIERDTIHDLALLKIRGDALPAMALGDSENVREGELYAFTGFPIGMVLGLRPVTHRGIVSVITPIAIPQLSSRTLDPRMIRALQRPYDVLQLDATAYPGNSGSPLYDPDSGAVVGVINKVFIKETKENVLKDPSGITYAIPVEHVRALLDKAGVR